MTVGGGGPGQFGDTTLTKVFVGGLAWETQKEALREHFEKYGEILEAVIISDKVTGRSKGYGFVTFKEAEAAKKACEDSTPTINGRRANCNLASLGARRPRSSSAAPQSVYLNRPFAHRSFNRLDVVLGSTVGSRTALSSPTSVQWYFPAGTPPSPFPHHHHRIPFHAYGYSPAYITDVGYNTKVSYSGSYINGQYSQIYPSQGMMAPNAVMPFYSFYHFHQPHTMGVPATHIFPTTTAGPITTIPAHISKPPPAMAPPNPNTVCLAVE
ncbi:putative RNA-binding protein ARP1 isoform X2 [Cinnamomum micranthum f. kanehirae]|uniref:Putative RNA-binding protein ARP1 isoform X2 n=1 Tax=Cinnamomum micranthum f. kanehirae TaxID=337451 RepID=A0A443NEE2_9MAGN|nr:putative RNA-binding protein ARP1 isoform X2 [Cinnamomum micranthum f. kanehirae]